MSTGPTYSRCNSASRRLASEMSESSRSRRFTSCWITRQQPLLALGRPGERQRFHRRTQRGQRVLELMRDVGCEALDRFDPVVKRAGHLAQRA